MATIANSQRGSRWLVTSLVTALLVPAPLNAQVLGTAYDGPPMETVAAPAPAVPTGLVPISTFRDRQLSFPRVRSAYERRSNEVAYLLEREGIDTLAEVFFRVFKREQILEVWARDVAADRFVLLETFPVCGTSGTLGPKRAQGDAQIPEGFYHIDLFNPVSQYHLSLRVDYPNAVDRVRGNGGRLGGDIFIHGGCATIGCVPVTDAWIEKVYLIALSARVAGQSRIPVHMFPTRLDEDGYGWLVDTFGHDHEDLPFWRDLRQGFLAFEQTRVVPEIGHHHGRYSVPLGTAQVP